MIGESRAEPPLLRWLTIIFLVGLAINVTCVLVWSRGHGPPRTGDGPDYDSIGYNLAAGRGYGHTFSDPVYRAPYEQSPQRDQYAPLLERQGEYHPTAYRPPALPFMLAGLYRTVGRDFLAWRLVSAVIVTLAITLAAWLGRRLATADVGQWVAILGFVDPVVKAYTGRILTEAPCMLGMVCLAWSLVLLIEGRLWRGWGAVVLTGLSAGVLVLTRSIFVLWFPLLCVLVAAWWMRRPAAVTATARARLGSALLAAALFAAAACVLPLPWWVRNCVVLDAFMPLGTQGGIGLPGGYSDVARENGGAWVNVEAQGFFAPHRARLEAAGVELSPIEWEREMARYGTACALAWITEDPGRTVRLVLRKLGTHWTGNDAVPALVMVVIGLVGLRRPGRTLADSVPWLLVVCNTVVVVVTYPTGDGRFIVPILPLVHVIAVLGGVEIARRIQGDAAPAGGDAS